MSQEVDPWDQHLREVIGDGMEEETRNWGSFPLLQDGVEDEDRRGHSGDD